VIAGCGVMVDYRTVLSSTGFLPIFNRLGGFVEETALDLSGLAMEDFNKFTVGTLTEETVVSFITPILGEPLTLSLQVAKEQMEELDENEEPMALDTSTKDLSAETIKQLEEIGLFDAAAAEMDGKIREKILQKVMEGELSNTEQLKLKQFISHALKQIAETLEFKNYVGHTFIRAYDMLIVEQIKDMGGLEDLTAVDPDPPKDVSDEFVIEDVETWQDKMREYKSLDWKDTIKRE
jgi:hypothetical protein